MLALDGPQEGDELHSFLYLFSHACGSSRIEPLRETQSKCFTSEPNYSFYPMKLSVAGLGQWELLEPIKAIFYGVWSQSMEGSKLHASM